MEATRAGDVPDRQIQFGRLPPFRCSGAYPKILSMIGMMKITNVVELGGRMNVRYDLLPRRRRRRAKRRRLVLSSHRFVAFLVAVKSNITSVTACGSYPRIKASDFRECLDFAEINLLPAT